MKAKSNISPFSRAWVVYKEDGLFKLFKAFFFHVFVQDIRLDKLQLRYYLLRGKCTFSIGSVRITMLVTQLRDALELRYIYETERRIWEDFLRELTPNDIFWDVGANTGFYSLLASNISRVEVIAFEPHPTTVKMLRKNIEINKKSNIKVINIALSNSEGRSKFDPGELDSTNGTARLAVNGIRGTIEVETASGDKLIGNGTVPRPDIIKLDVEGAEHLVIKGLQSALTGCRVLFCEVHPDIRQYGSSAEDLERTLKNMGFSIQKFRGDRGDGTYHIKATRLVAGSSVVES